MIGKGQKMSRAYGEARGLVGEAAGVGSPSE